MPPITYYLSKAGKIYYYVSIFLSLVLVAGVLVILKTFTSLPIWSLILIIIGTLILSFILISLPLIFKIRPKFKEDYNKLNNK